MAAGLAILGVSTALKIGSAIADHVAQGQQADATKQAARRALRLKRRDLAIRGIEERESASQRREVGAQQAARAAGQARLSAASAGVRGASADALIHSIDGDLGRYYRSVDNNLVVTLDQLDRMEEGFEAEAQARINGAPDASLTGTMLRIGGAVAGSLNSWNNYNNPVGDDIDPAGTKDAARAAKGVTDGY